MRDKQFIILYKGYKCVWMYWLEFLLLFETDNKVSIKQILQFASLKFDHKKFLSKMKDEF